MKRFMMFNLAHTLRVLYIVNLDYQLIDKHFRVAIFYNSQFPKTCLLTSSFH